MATSTCSSAAVLLALLLLAAPPCCRAEAPNGVHLSLTENAGEMRAMWSLPATAATPALAGLCRFGPAPDSLLANSSVGVSYTYADGGFKGALFNVVMSGLRADSTYFYTCGSEGEGWSSVFRFATPPASSSASMRAVVWGDMGVDNVVSTPKFTRDSVAKDVTENNYTLIINVGDTSYANDYNPADSNAHINDEFWQSVQSSAAYAPLMLCPGNHESQFQFAAHLNRTHMPVVAAGPLRRFYYSFAYGPVFFITFSTEHPYANGTEQWLFVEQELKRATANRTQWPWLVVFTHHPFYCSSLLYTTSRCGSEMAAFLAAYEDLFNQYGVDVFLSGHDHMYERTFPVRNRVPVKQYHRPGAPVYVVEGDAGTLESIFSMVEENVPWRAFAGTGRETGYGRIEANATAFTYSHVVSKSYEVTDTFTLTK